MRDLGKGLLIFAVFSIGTGLAYPFAITGLAQWLFSGQAQGSLVTAGGKVVGSRLIGQGFSGPAYFHGRPSANKYDASNSGGSNYGPTNRKYLEEVAGRVKEVRSENNLPADAPVPADLVLASASGLDPDISLPAALVQVPRIAKARGMSEDVVKGVVAGLTKGQRWGHDRVNVLELNLALDGATKK